MTIYRTATANDVLALADIRWDHWEEDPHEYAPSTADNTKQKIMSRPEVKKAFEELLVERIPPEKLVRCICEGLDATRIKLYRDGDVVEAIETPDHRVRLMFALLALKLKGWDSTPSAEPRQVILNWGFGTRVVTQKDIPGMKGGRTQALMHSGFPAGD